MNQNTAARDEVIDELREEIERLWKERNEARDTNIKYLKQIEQLQIELKAARAGLGGLQETVERLRAALQAITHGEEIEAAALARNTLAVNEQNAIGKYKADYAPLTEAEQDAPTGAEELLKRSKPV